MTGTGPTIREYGTSGPWLVVVHGGPGAAGSMAPVARDLSGSFRVLEPWQRGSSDEPLTVARHVEDLHDIVKDRCGGERPALLGSSWGAMLILAYAAAHPGRAAGLVLVGCGTFTRAARRKLEETLQGRMDPETRRRLEGLTGEISDPDIRFAAFGRMLLPLYSYDPIETDPGQDLELADARAFRETWADMLRLQKRGVYPKAFSAIDVPVFMVHGDTDPHPGRSIRDSLKHHVRHLEYRELERCGHYPWLERHARVDFYLAVVSWLDALRAGV